MSQNTILDIPPIHLGTNFSKVSITKDWDLSAVKSYSFCVNVSSKRILAIEVR